jgi:WD40 repeat protein
MPPASALHPPPCTDCGAVIPADAPHGQCPRCLIRLATAPTLAQDDPLLLDALPRRFGDYELVEEIARGGMGIVFRARQTRLNRELALKILPAGELASPESILRFRTEAAAAARLAHPHIVPVHEIGEHDLTHYFTMRFIPGRRHIADWARALPPEGRSQAIATTLAKVARAVAFAHEHGVLHRDLKPSNLLMDENDAPQVTDFGLARLYEEADSAVTLSRQILGSPSYMAPEQAEGRRDDETTLTDLYGLGAVLYEMLAGRPPFIADSPIATARKVVEETPARLANVPRDLETICLKCLEKAPQRRYASALELAEELERFARNEPILARPVSLPEALWRLAQRRPKTAALLGLLVLSFVGGFGGVFWQWQRAEVARDQALSANKALRASVAQLEWRRAVQMLDSGELSGGMAQLARLLRADPANPRAASLAISVLEQGGFATPVAPPISHGEDYVVTQARLSPDGRGIVSGGSDGTARLWVAATSAPGGKGMRHTGPVRWVEYSPDGRRVATASDDGTAREWDAATGDPLSPPLSHGGAVIRLAFAGERLATVSADGTAAIWEKGTLLHRLDLGGAGIALAWSPDGGRLYTASSVGVKAWSLDGRELFSHPMTGVAGVLPSPDGSRLAAWSEVGFWMGNAATGESSGVTFEEMSGLLAVTWSPDGKRLAGGAVNNWARVWDPSSGRAVTPKLKHHYACCSVVFSPDGRTLISGGHDGVSRRWDLASSLPTAAPILHREAVIGSEHCLDGVKLLVVNHPWNDRSNPRGGTARLWDLEPRGRRPLRFVDPLSRSASSVAWSPDGTVWVGNGVGGGLVMQVGEEAPFALPGSKIQGWARGMGFLPDGDRFLVVSTTGEYSLWSVAEQRRVFGPVALGSVESVRLFPDGKRVVIGLTSGEVAVREVATAAVLVKLPAHRAPLNCVDVSPDGRVVASAGEDGRCLLSDAATGQPLVPVIEADDEFVSVRFSHDGKWIVTASHDRTARIWGVTSGALRGHEMRHDGEVAYAEFSPDDTRVLTADRSGAATLWHAATGEPIGDPMRHGSALRHARFSPDGTRLVTEDHLGQRLWESASGEPLTLLQPHPTGIGIGFFSQGTHTSFSPDGRSVLHGTASRDFLRWDFPAPPVPAPAWLPDLLEAVAGLSITESNRLVHESGNRWLEMRVRLAGLTGDDFYARWARDYVGEK